MKRLFSILILIVLVFAGCEMNTLIVDEGFSLLGFSLIAEGVSADSSARGTSSNGLKLAFRSSDIEFWAAGDNYTNLISTKFVSGGVTDKNESIEISLSDTAENVVFMPNKVHIERGYEMPNFDMNKVYNIVRMDIGSGQLTLTMNGNPVNASNSTLSSTSLNANSIVLVDRNIMHEAHYISRLEMRNINDYNYNVDDDFIKEFNSNIGSIDVDGALFLPFDSIDFAGKNKAKNVHIRLKWNMDDIFDMDNVLKGTADGTPYDFSVEVEIN